MSINIFGVVGEDVRAAIVIPQIQSESGDTIEVNIMSVGGSVIEGLAIYDALRSSKKKVITRAIGQAASIASIIFMAGDEREVADNAEIMIHNALVGACGNKHELAEFIDRLDGIDQKLINIYASRTSLNETQVRDLLDKETFMDADEAVKLGFATVKADALALVAKYNSTKQQEKEPVIMAKEEKEDGLLSKIIALFKSDAKAEDTPVEEPEAMEEEPKPEEPEAMEEESEETKALKAEIENLKASLAEAQTKAESVPDEVKEEAKAITGLILDALSDDKLTMHEAKNCTSKSLADVKAILAATEQNATGRGQAPSPKSEPKTSSYDQYKSLSDPSERHAFFAKHQNEIINQSKES